jgi:hypothetical protein
MIKNINPQNILLTPFIALKDRELFNNESEDLVILEDTGSETPVALEFIDYSTDDPFLNRACNIALEQQSSDLAIFQEGVSGSGTFYPDSEHQNRDHTYKRLIYSQIKSTFYNTYNNPLQIFGVEYIDFPLSKTFRDISDFIRVFTIPRNIFGERLTEKSIEFFDNSLDDNVIIVDDGYQNLTAGNNLFSKIQEVRKFGNIIIPGTSSFVCYTDTVTSIIDDLAYPSVRVGFASGLLINQPPYIDTSVSATTFYTGSIATAVMTGSSSETSSMMVSLLSGSIFNEVITSSLVLNTSSVMLAFSSGAIFEEIITSSFSRTSSLSVTFLSGSIFNQAVTTGFVSATSSMGVTFLSGSIN